MGYRNIENNNLTERSSGSTSERYSPDSIINEKCMPYKHGRFVFDREIFIRFVQNSPFSRPFNPSERVSLILDEDLYTD